jgi:hypothetical protein
MVMELSDGSANIEKSIRTIHRLGPWQFVEEKVDHFRRSLKITHDSRRVSLRYIHSEGRPHEQLTITRNDPAPTDAPAPTTVPAISMQPKDLDRSEMVLGETCRWFDMMPGMRDMSELACRTSDGIVLKEKLSGRSSERNWTAVRMTRRPISLDEIKPPAELLEPQRWGIE